jgi:hypothetical protein
MLELGGKLGTWGGGVGKMGEKKKTLFLYRDVCEVLGYCNKSPQV